MSDITNEIRPRSAIAEIFAQLGISVLALVVITVLGCGVYPVVVWGISQLAFPQQANGSLVSRDDGTVIGSTLIGQNFTAAKYFHGRPSAAGSGNDATDSGGTNLGPTSDKLINGATNAATTQPTVQPESLAFDGVRLRTIHYAVDNGIPFKLYNVNPDGSRVEVPLGKFKDAQGNLNDIALVDAFPHPPSDASDRVTLVAADFATPIPTDAVTASGSGLDPHISVANALLQAPRVAAARKISLDAVQKAIDENTDGRSWGIFGEAGVNVLKLNIALDKASK